MAASSDLFGMYRFLHEGDIGNILEHPSLKGKKPGEWKMMEMIEEGLVRSFRIKQIVETENGRFRFICIVAATFIIHVRKKGGLEFTRTISFQNLFGTNTYMDLGAREIAVAFAKDAVTDGEGEFLLDIWADSIYNDVSMTATFEKGGNGKCFMVYMDAKDKTETRMKWTTASSCYYNIWCEKEKFLLGDMWFCSAMAVENRCIMIVCKKEGTESEDDRLFNIVTENGKLLWKHWVKLRRVLGTSDGMPVELPGYGEPVYLDWRRFCFKKDEGKEVERIEFYKDGRLLNEKEIRESFDRDDELKLV